MSIRNSVRAILTVVFATVVSQTAKAQAPQEPPPAICLAETGQCPGPYDLVRFADFPYGDPFKVEPLPPALLARRAEILRQQKENSEELKKIKAKNAAKAKRAKR